MMTSVPEDVTVHEEENPKDKEPTSDNDDDYEERETNIPKSTFFNNRKIEIPRNT